MGKGAIAIGVIFILIGLIAGSGIIISDVSNWSLLNPALLILFVIGVGLIAFYKEEGRIEQRKDLLELKEMFKKKN